MKSKSLIALLVVIQISVIAASFAIILSIDLQTDNLGDYVNISGKNRFYTAFLLHEMDEFSSGVIGEKEIDDLFDEYEGNIKLLKNGGDFLGREIAPIPLTYSNEMQVLEVKFEEFKIMGERLKDEQTKQTPLDESYMIKHEQLEFELIGAAENLTNKLNMEFDEIIQQKEILEIILPIINAIVYVTTVYVIFRTLREETKKMQKLEKLYTIGQMASRLAHDLRNSITVIKANLDFMQMKYKDDQTLMERSGRMQCSVLDMNHIIEDVLEFAKTKQLNLGRHSLLEIISESISSLNVPEEIQIEMPKTDAEITCDARKIQAIIVNIIVNAFDALEGKGKVTITIEDEPKKTTIQITDSGPGIPDDIIASIFEPLFTSKPTGTGLGLGISKNIVEQHGGKISVKNNPTTFTIVLPKTVKQS